MKLGRIQKKYVAVIILATAFISSFITYSFAGSVSNTLTLSAGAYPGSASYTIFTDGSNYYAKDQNGVVDYSGTVFSTVVQAANDALTSGGKITILRGVYSQTAKITVDEGVVIDGECWGDDSVEGVRITRTANVVMFDVAGDHACIKNLYLNGSAAYTATYVTMNTYRYNHLECLTFEDGDCYGIEVQGAYWIDINHIRGIRLGDYIISAMTGGNVNVKINDVIGYRTEGLVEAYGIVNFELTQAGTDYWPAINVPAGQGFIYLGTIYGSVRNVAFEGNTTAGFPKPCLLQAGGIVSYSNLRFWYCGDPTTTCAVMQFNSHANATIESAYFDNSLGYLDIYQEATDYVTYNNIVWALGTIYPSYWDNRVVAHTAESYMYQYEAGCLHTNEGATTTIILHLQGSMPIGATYRVLSVETEYIAVDPPDAGAFYYNQVKQSDGLYVVMENIIGAYMEFVSVGNSDWLIVEPYNSTLAWFESP